MYNVQDYCVFKITLFALFCVSVVILLVFGKHVYNIISLREGMWVHELV